MIKTNFKITEKTLNKISNEVSCLEKYNISQISVCVSKDVNTYITVISGKYNRINFRCQNKSNDMIQSVKLTVNDAKRKIKKIKTRNMQKRKLVIDNSEEDDDLSVEDEI